MNQKEKNNLKGVVFIKCDCFENIEDIIINTANNKTIALYCILKEASDKPSKFGRMLTNKNPEIIMIK
jgi:hypothetical protein